MKVKVKELEIAIKWWQVLLIIAGIILVLKIGSGDAVNIINTVVEKIIEK